MNFSSWDWWDTFRLHEAACLIAGVPVGPNRAPELEEIPADARPVLKRLISAFYQGQDYLKLPEKIGCAPAKIMIGLPRDGTEAITEFLVSREELHRWIQAMGYKSAYQFLPFKGVIEPGQPTISAVEQPLHITAKSSPVAVCSSDEVKPAADKRWTPERLAELKSYREKHGTKKAAEFFRISESLIRRKLPSEKPQPKGFSAFTHCMK